MSRPLRRRPTRPLHLTALLGTALATAAVTLAAPPSTAAGSATAADPDARAASRTVVASGLDNPRQLSFDRRGRLFVAESGQGGDGTCVGGAESGEVCYGTSGAVTMVAGGRQRRVVTGLPSLAPAGGNEATGPVDVSVDDRGHYRVTVGLGGDEEFRREFPPPARRQLGTVIGGSLGGDRYVYADLAAYEQDNDPDGAGADSNPGGFTRTGRGLLVTDAGGNTLLRARFGRVSTVAEFADTPDVPNPFGGPPGPMQAVPTSVTPGPGGSYFVSQLTGFPFPKGGATVFQVVPGRAPTVWATGLTNLTDLVWSRGRLYAVQLADDGLLAGAPGGPPPSGSLVRVRRGSSSPTTVVDDLVAPYGVAVRNGSAYVTTCSVCADGGGVTRVRLP